MKNNAVFIYSPEFLRYHFGDEHPFNSLRLQVTKDLLDKSGILYKEDIVEPKVATEAELQMVHSPEYVKAVQEASRGVGYEELGDYELGTDDNPVFEGMHSAASLVAGGTLTGVEMVMKDECKRAVNLAGGLHHAHRSKASGFCIYNDAAVAIAYIRQKYDLRVLYLDTDAHHCDGVQNIFYDDPEVLVISLHETGHYLFPGTGDIYEQGSDMGFGATINIPVEPFTDDDSWISAFETVVIPNARAFAPHIIITQNGCDGHYLDSLTHLSLTMKSFDVIPRLTCNLAEQLCGGKLIAVGGGGYNLWQVTPRAWAYLWSNVSGRNLGDRLPEEWIKKWQKTSSAKLPEFFEDEEGLVPETPRREEINEKNQIIVNRIMRQSVQLL